MTLDEAVETIFAFARELGVDPSDEAGEAAARAD
jgi:hypothetical protein